MTHGPPRPTSQGNNDYFLDIGHEGQQCGCPKLYKAIRRTTPALHCFGHIHEGYGAQVFDYNEETFKKPAESDIINARGQGTTLLVSAAIQTRIRIPNNKPWVLDVGLR